MLLFSPGHVTLVDVRSHCSGCYDCYFFVQRTKASSDLKTSLMLCVDTVQSPNNFSFLFLSHNR